MKNLVIRTVSGVLFVGVLAGSLLYLPDFLPLLLALALWFILKEFYGISLGDSLKPARLLAGIASVCLCWTLWYVRRGMLDPRFLSLCIIPLLAIPVFQIFSFERFELEKLSYIAAGLVFIGLPVALAPVLLVRDGAVDGTLMLCFFILIWCSDVGAYCIGTLFGQKTGSRKLAPHISPKKSWWGVFGGVLTGLCGAIVLNFTGLLDLPFYHSLAIAAIICLSSVIGDLFESLWKRHFGVKDSGKAIPGHGGLLDRFDSSLAAIPAATVYMLLFNLF